MPWAIFDRPFGALDDRHFRRQPRAVPWATFDRPVGAHGIGPVRHVPWAVFGRPVGARRGMGLGRLVPRVAPWARRSLSPNGATDDSPRQRPGYNE